MNLPAPVMPSAPSPVDVYADRLRRELTDIIGKGITGRPRDLQRTIGPSELGHECSRFVLHKLAGAAEPRPRAPAWRPAVGTAIHSMLETIFHRETPGRWLTEQRVTVGHLPDGTPITGTADLIDRETVAVIDWKTKSKTALNDHRVNGPSQQYRVQAHAYAGGCMLAGHGTPEYVAIVALPRDGELGDMAVWAEPWDPQFWAASMRRVNDLWNELRAHGLDRAVDAYPICDDTWCPWCTAQRHTTPTAAFAAALNQ